MKLNNLKSCIFRLPLILVLAGNSSRADDSLSALMQRMKSDTAVSIAYQETRKLELMDQPWRGSGYMYSLPPDIMIKEQLKPERVLMGIQGDKLFYFEPLNNVRHQGGIEEDNPLILNIAVFKALMNADKAFLQKIYRVDFSTKPQGWLMTLKPKQDTESGFIISISGLPQQWADTIKVRQADGDVSEFSLRKEAAGDEIKSTVNRLYRELLGE
jgi:hypothetical protein